MERECGLQWRHCIAVAVLLAAGASLPTGAAAQVTVEACDNVTRLVAEAPSLVISGTDTLVHDDRFGRTAPGCLVRMAGQVPAFRGTTRPDEFLRQKLTSQGWLEDLRYGADGPDGTAFAYVRGDVLCMVRAAWDGGDDTDPSYVPEDRYELVIGCIPAWRQRSEPIQGYTEAPDILAPATHSPTRLLRMSIARMIAT